MDVSVVIVSYNAQNALIKCLSTLAIGMNDLKYEVIIVDNNSGDDSVQLIKKKFPEFAVIKNKSNIGFGRACNQGAKNTSGKYILFLNSDCCLRQDAVKVLFNYLESNDNCSLVGPCLVAKNGNRMNSCFRFPNLYRPHLNYHWLFKDKFLLAYSPNDPVRNMGGKVDWLSGACFLIRATDFKKLNGFDEDFFMYYEDTDLCQRIKRVGGEVIYYPDVRVEHESGGSSKGVKNWLDLVNYKSRLIYYKKHFFIWVFYIELTISVLGAFVRAPQFFVFLQFEKMRIELLKMAFAVKLAFADVISKERHQ